VEKWITLERAVGEETEITSRTAWMERKPIIHLSEAKRHK